MATNPTLLSMPIAENGTKNTIPETQATPGNGLMSQSTGFPAECSLPLGAGGIAPDRADFNGAFNLLSGVAFMAQKGFTFNYDSTQDYYKGCVVIDPTDGNRYLCIADMAAGTVAPSADTTGDYWIFYPVGVINKRDVITTSGTYTAPVDGWYKITIKGGGGGGGSGNVNYTGSGGGEGGTTIGFEYMTTGQTANIVIGAGGGGGNNGGASSAEVNSNTYTAGGGGSGTLNGYGGDGGTGTTTGNRGGSSEVVLSGYTGNGGVGGGENGGSGGRGGASPSGGYSGNNGYVWFEYFAEV